MSKYFRRKEPQPAALKVSDEDCLKDGSALDNRVSSAFKRGWHSGTTPLSELYDGPSLTASMHVSVLPHAPRHLYGRFLWKAGRDGMVLQRRMHHRIYDSHKVYTQLSASEIDNLFRKYGAGEGRPHSSAALHTVATTLSEPSHESNSEDEHD